MSIIEQQLELHFGEEYLSVQGQARRFVASVQATYNKYGSRLGDQMIDGEGGMGSVVLTAMATIIEVGDVRGGLERWAKRMAQLYMNNHERGYSSLTDFTDYDIPLAETGEGESLLGDSFNPLLGFHPKHAHSEEVLVTDILRQPEEVELYETIASVGSLAEAADVLGLEYKRARTIDARIIRRLGSKPWFFKRGPGLAIHNRASTAVSKTSQ